MDSPALLQLQFKSAHRFLEDTLQSVTPEMLRYVPVGPIATIGGHYLHVLASEDLIMHGILQGAAPLYATAWAGKIGSSEVPQFFTWGEWGRTAVIDMDAAKAYAAAIYEATDKYVESLTPEKVGEKIDLNAIGFGNPSRGGFLTVALQNIYIHTGEISTLKGLQGAKGYTL